jgi:hypothetical protein
MAMRVMHIRRVGMRVRYPSVYMGMRMRLSRRIIGAMPMLMMLVMHV